MRWTYPVQRARKFSAVRGTTSERSSMTTRPTSAPPIVISKKTLGFGIVEIIKCGWRWTVTWVRGKQKQKCCNCNVFLTTHQSWFHGNRFWISRKGFFESWLASPYSRDTRESGMCLWRILWTYEPSWSQMFCRITSHIRQNEGISSFLHHEPSLLCLSLIVWLVPLAPIRSIQKTLQETESCKTRCRSRASSRMANDQTCW